jgi:hypothetical protein
LTAMLREVRLTVANVTSASVWRPALNMLVVGAGAEGDVVSGAWSCATRGW